VQGYGPQVGWTQLAEAVVAVRGGARHVATNTDATIPSPRGVLPGNGALVGVVSTVTGQQPLVTGKPDPAMHAECVRRTGAQRPLVVGDRLDTDIEGARRAGAASLLVLTGVATPADLLAAGPDHRPDLLAPDAAGVLVTHPGVTAVEGAWRCGGWQVTRTGDELTLARTGTSEPDGDGLDGLRALAVAHWDRHRGQGHPAVVRAGDDEAAEALAGWGLSAG
jgi:glycerol 3-phosphatase-2